MSNASESGSTTWDRIRQSFRELESRSQQRQASGVAVSEKLARRALLFREKIQQPEDSGPTHPFLFFSMNREKYAIPLENVIEILALDAFSSVPGAPEFIHGVVHFRGQILSLINLNRLLGAVDVGIGDVHFQVIAEVEGQRFAIGAGDVEDLVSLPLSAIHSAQSLSSGSFEKWVRGVYQSQRLVLQMEEIIKDEAFHNWSGTGRSTDVDLP